MQTKNQATQATQAQSVPKVQAQRTAQGKKIVSASEFQQMQEVLTIFSKYLKFKMTTRQKVITHSESLLERIKVKFSQNILIQEDREKIAKWLVDMTDMVKANRI